MPPSAVGTGQSSPGPENAEFLLNATYSKVQGKDRKGNLLREAHSTEKLRGLSISVLPSVQITMLTHQKDPKCYLQEPMLYAIALQVLSGLRHNVIKVKSIWTSLSAMGNPNLKSKWQSV